MTYRQKATPIEPTVLSKNYREQLQMDLPDYVAIDLANEHQPTILRQVAAPVQFPLSAEDQRDLGLLEAKFDGEENCAGLAAPQIGISKRMLVFAAPDNPDMRKWRPDFTQAMEKTIWINPVYTAIGSEMHSDYESCFSIIGLAGLIQRYKRIRYEATLPSGDTVSGEAEGFLARIMQHEIDHLNGILFIDRAEEGSLIGIEEYRKRRAQAMGQDSTLSSK
jgi:peptide deformylase